MQGNKKSNNVWVISKGNYTDLDLKNIIEGMGTTSVREYRLSSFGYYLLNPNTIEVQKRINGCEVYYTQPASNKIRSKIRRFLPKSLRGLFKDREVSVDKILAPAEKKLPSLTDHNLKKHFKNIDDQLRMYDPLIKKLSKLDLEKIENIKGICEGIDDNRLCLDLKGSVKDKIRYISNNLLKKVAVILEKAYVSENLFELRGYDFSAYDSKKEYRLIIFLKDSEPKACVLNAGGDVEYWVDDIKLVHYSHLLEQSINTNMKLRNVFNRCITGENKPLVLYFNRQLEIDYSKTHVPQIYKNIFDTYNIEVQDRKEIVNSLNNLQFGISLKYISKSSGGQEKPLVSISVMHNVKALEPIKKQLPQVYSEINKMAPETDAGRFYLLDTMRGE